MKISNQDVFNLPALTTPQIQYGRLNPRVSWGDAPLASMPVGSMYLQQVMAYNEQGDPTVTQGFWWLKTCESGDCSGGSDVSAWILAGSTSIMGGVNPLNPAVEPWSVAQLGTLYLREQASDGVCGNLREIWIRVGPGTDSCDWFSIAETRAVGNIFGVANITSSHALTQTTDYDTVAWYDLNGPHSAASVSCDNILAPTTTEFTLPESGLYKLHVYATGQSGAPTYSTEVLAVGFKKGLNYYTLDTSTFSGINRAFANGEYMLYAEAGSKVSPAVWTTSTDVTVDAASMSIEYLGA